VLKHLWAVALGLIPLTVPALAEPVNERGYFVGCDGADCLLVASGFRFYVRDDGTMGADLLAGLDPMTAVTFVGDMLSMGDISAELDLTEVALVPDDLLQDTLRALQGDWHPDGEDTPYFIRIIGLEWQEITPPDEVNGAYLISVGTTCANGVEPGGPALVLHALGGDPDAAACWQVQYIDDTTLELRDFMGDWGLVTYTRRD
jgi:hypothetical protein